MEVSGVAFRRVLCLSGAVIDAHSAKPSVAVGPSEFRVLGYGDSKAFMRPRKSYGALMINSGFCDNGHLQYYYAGPRCGGKKEKEKEKAVTAKKKLKLLKGLTKDLSKFSDMGFGVDSDDDLAQRKAISDAAEVLMKQLQHLRAEDDLKRKSKQETSKLDCESSSSESSESSDSECEEVIDMSSLRSEPHEEPAQPDELQSVTQENATTSTLSSWLTEEGNTTEANGLGDCRSENNEVECCTKISTSCSNISSNVGHNDISSVATGAQRIEVCMGKKCKKSGGPALLEEFGRVIGVEGAVVECKCLGKCKDGPNVRVLNCADDSQTEGFDVSVRAPTNPLVLGVALQDVGVIVSNFFGDDQKDLAAAA